jgi:putative endonuclease
MNKSAGEPQFFVYFLKSLTSGKVYVGYTDDLDRRLAEHNAGRGGQYTRHNGPWKLIYSEPQPNRSSAMKRERFLKSGKGYREKKQLVDRASASRP